MKIATRCFESAEEGTVRIQVGSPGEQDLVVVFSCTGARAFAQALEDAADEADTQNAQKAEEAKR